MTTTASGWESLTGRRDVLIGASFTRAWNERIGKTVKRSKDYPNPEYYSLRYNFKPESIDNDNAGTLTPKPGGDGQAVFELERPSLQPGESHHFTAVEQRSREWECVLLWDPVLQQLTLEKLESTLNLTHEGRGGTKGRPPSSTPPSLPGSSRGNHGTASTSRGKLSPSASPMVSARELADDLERALAASADADAEGEPDGEFEFEAELDAAAAASMKQEEDDEEDEDEMEAVVVAPLPPPPPPAKPKATPKAKASGRARPRASTKRDRDDDIDEELLTFGQPSRPTKRTRRVSANEGAGNLGLALPTPPTQSYAAPTPSELLQPPSSSTTRITYAGSDSGSESDDSDDGGQELGDALEAAALELELEQTLAEEAEDADDDEGMVAVPLENGRHDSGRPLSLNELLGGQSQNDDDTTTDDSDDD